MNRALTITRNHLLWNGSQSLLYGTATQAKAAKEGGEQLWPLGPRGRKGVGIVTGSSPAVLSRYVDVNTRESCSHTARSSRQGFPPQEVEDHPLYWEIVNVEETKVNAADAEERTPSGDSGPLHGRRENEGSKISRCFEGRETTGPTTVRNVLETVSPSRNFSTNTTVSCDFQTKENVNQSSTVFHTALARRPIDTKGHAERTTRIALVDARHLSRRGSAGSVRARDRGAAMGRAPRRFGGCSPRG